MGLSRPHAPTVKVKATFLAVTEPPALKPEEDRPQAVAPFVAYFPSDYKPCGGEGQPLKFGLHASKRPLHKRKRELVASRDGVDFVGKIPGPENTGPPACKYALAAFDKATGEIKVIPVSGGVICRVEVRAHRANYDPKNGEKDVGGKETAGALRTAQNKRLVDAFGSTRRQRQLANTESSMVDVERVGASEVVAGMMAKAQMEAREAGMTKDQVLARVVGQRNIPPHHLEATKGAEAFVLAEVVPGGIRLEFTELLGASEEPETLKAMKSRGFVHPYVVSRVEEVLQPREGASAAQKEERKMRAKALAYLSILLNLHSAPRLLRPVASRGGLSALANYARIPQDAMEELLEAFYERSSSDDGEDIYTRPAVRGELLLCHICLAALLAEGCKMDAAQFDELRGVLKMTGPELLTRFRELGTKATPVMRGKGARSYHLALLQDGKTLQESLPGIRMGRKAGGR